MNPPIADDSAGPSGGGDNAHEDLLEALNACLLVEPSGSGRLDDWRVVAANPLATTLFAAPSPTGLIGAPLSSLLVSQDLSAVARLLKAIAGGGRQEPLAVRVRTLNEEAQCRLGANTTPSGPLRLVFAAAPCIWELERQAISHYRYRQVFQNMPIALLRIDGRGSLSVFEAPRRQGVTDLGAYLDAHPEIFQAALDSVAVAEANPHAEAVFGAGAPGSMVRSVRPYWMAAPETFRRILIARYSGARVLSEETQVCTLAGEPVDVHFTMAFPPADAPEADSLVGMIDIRDRVRAETELLSAQSRFAEAARSELTRELSASIAHEVSQPLASVLANGGAAHRWLKRSPPNLAKTAERIERIIAEADRASLVIQRLRAQAAGQAVPHGAVDLNAVARGAILHARGEARSKAVRLRLYLDPNLPAIRGDAVQLTQVVVNLLINGVQAVEQACARERLVDLATRAGGPGSVILAVSDSGGGVAPGDVERIFESFYTTKPSGIGLGLAICRSILDAHAGALSVANRPGGGAVFTVELPSAP